MLLLSISLLVLVSLFVANALAAAHMIHYCCCCLDLLLRLPAAAAAAVAPPGCMLHALGVLLLVRRCHRW
jgi:hypothetical protein